MDEFNNNMGSVQDNNTDSFDQTSAPVNEVNTSFEDNVSSTPIIEGVPEEKQTLATVSLVFGILSIVLSCCCGIVGFICSAVAIATGIIVKVKNKPGEKLALAGIITGGVGVITFIISIVMNASLLASMQQ